MKIKGFTLIEILSAIVILGILTTVGVVAFSNFSNAAKEKITEKPRPEIISTIKY